MLTHSLQKQNYHQSSSVAGTNAASESLAVETLAVRARERAALRPSMFAVPSGWSPELAARAIKRIHWIPARHEAHKAQILNLQAISFKALVELVPDRSALNRSFDPRRIYITVYLSSAVTRRQTIDSRLHAFPIISPGSSRFSALRIMARDWRIGNNSVIALPSA